MKFILISGDGIGAGKTSFAKHLEFWFEQTRRMSLADGIRDILSTTYPAYSWYNTTQEYKETLVIEVNKTIRELLRHTGQYYCEMDKDFWCTALLRRIVGSLYGDHVIIVDDLRKVSELEFFKSQFPVTHFHMESSKATEEHYDNQTLKKLADYRISWGA